jgi:predicted MFS family arabinose efflux permease
MTIVASGIVTVALLVATAALVQETRPVGAGNSWQQGFRQVPVMVGDAFQLSKNNRIVVLLLAVTLVGGLALASIETFWSPRFAELLGGSEGNSIIFAAIMGGNFIFGMVGNMASIPLSRLMKKRYALVAAVFQGGQGLMLILLALQTGVIPAVAFFWLVYLGRGVIASPHETLMNQEIPAERRSSMLSVQSLASYVGGILGSIVLGFVAKNSSIATAWIVAGAVLLVSLLLYVQVDQRRAIEEEQDEPEAAFLEVN